MQEVFSSCTLAFDPHINDFDVFKGLIRLVRFRVLNRVHNLEPTQHATKDGVLVVQPRRRVCRDEELGAIRIWTCIGHADRIRTKKSMVSV